MFVWFLNKKNILRIRWIWASFIWTHHKETSTQCYQPPLINLKVLDYNLDESEWVTVAGKDTSRTGSLPPQLLTSWPADFSPPGLQSSSHWPCPLLARPESCSLCPWDQKRSIWSRRVFPHRNSVKLPHDPAVAERPLTKTVTVLYLKTTERALTCNHQCKTYPAGWQMSNHNES